MAIVQEDRLDAPRPEVEETDYGAQYVKAATETPVEQPKEESVEEQTHEEAVEVKQPAKKGRPRKKK